MARYQGGCACGAVRYKIDAEPAMAGHCQCRKCQQLSGGGHATFVVFAADAVEIKGKLTFWSYTADSGNIVSRGHCPACGSTVQIRNAGFADMVGVPVGSLDDPADVSPNMSFFSTSAQPWDHLGGNLTSFTGMPPM